MDITPYMKNIVFIVNHNTPDIVIESIYFKQVMHILNHGYIMIHGSYFYDTSDPEDYYTYQDCTEFLEGLLQMCPSKDYQDTLQFISKFEDCIDLYRMVSDFHKL